VQGVAAVGGTLWKLGSAEDDTRVRRCRAIRVPAVGIMRGLRGMNVASALADLLRVQLNAAEAEEGPLHRLRRGWGAAAEDTTRLPREDIR
jgi:hypothetical protein